MNISEKIKLLRKKKGISQQELADLTGINMSYVSRLENGHHEPSIEVIKSLMKVFDVTSDYLILDEQESFEIMIKDKSLAERIRLIDTLPEKKKEALIEIIDDMLTNQKLRSLLDDKLEAAVG